jgi:predicted PurR-regulated permease PerM
VVSILVALFAGYPHVLWLVLVFIVARLILDYGVQPYLMSQGVELPPLAVLIGVLGGEALGGILGIFLSIPVMAIARLIYNRYRERSQRRMVGAPA